MREKKIATSITVTDQAQVAALAISLLARLSMYEHEKTLRTIAAYFNYDIIEKARQS